MPVAGTDMVLYKPATVATSFATASVGGAISGTAITGSSVGEIFFAMESQDSGSGNLTQYGKWFDKNTHGSDTVDSYGVWLSNAIDDIATANTLTVVSDSASDNSSYFIRAIGLNNDGDAIQQDKTLNGTTEVNFTLQFKGKVRVEYRAVSGEALTNATGNITIKHGVTTVGFIPAGLQTAQNEVDIGLASALDDTATIADASTAPSAVTFSRPRTQATRLVVDGGTGTMLTGEAQGIWGKWTLVELIDPSTKVQVSTRGYGLAA